MGGATAIYALSTNADLCEQLILESTYTTANEVVVDCAPCGMKGMARKLSKLGWPSIERVG